MHEKYARQGRSFVSKECENEEMIQNELFIGTKRERINAT